MSPDLQQALWIAASIGLFAGLCAYASFEEFFDVLVHIFKAIWEAMVRGLRWLVIERDRRTPVQKMFKTDLKWHEVRWSIARMEHELLPADEWTHDVEDCVHKACNPDFIRKMRDGKLVYYPRPPKASKGGATSAREYKTPF